MNNQLTFEQGIRETIPTVFGYIGIGLAFGIIASSNGLNAFVVFLLSAVVYAGSGQFVMVTLLALKSPILSIVMSVFLVNSRMILLSTTVAPFFKKESLFKNVLIGTFLTDESFALGMSKKNYTEGILKFEWFNVVNLLAYSTWVVSTVIGSLVGQIIPNPSQFGFEFAVVAMFIGLLYLQVIGDHVKGLKLQVIVILLTLVLFYFGLIFIPGNILILFVTLLACGLGVFIKRAFF